MVLNDEILKRAGNWKILCQNHNVKTLYAFGSSTNDGFDPLSSDINKYHK